MVVPSVIHVIPPTICGILAIYVLYLGWNKKSNIVLLFFLLVLTAYGIIQVIKQGQTDKQKVENIAVWGTALWGLLVPLSYHTLLAVLNERKRINNTYLYFLYFAGAIIIAFSLNGFTIFKEHYLAYWGWEAVSDFNNLFFWYFFFFLLSGIPAFIFTLHSIKHQTNDYRTQKLVNAILVNFIWGASFSVLPYCFLSFFRLPMEIILDYFEAFIMILIVFSILKYQPENISTNCLFTSITNFLPAEMILVSPEKIILLANKEHFHITGFNRREIEGKPFDKIFKNSETVKNEFVRINRDANYSALLETDCYSSTGNIIKVKITISGLYNTFNDLCAYMIFFNGIHQDIDIFGYLQTAFNLSSREKAIVALLIKGHTYPQISDQLYISMNTLKTHTRNIYKKTGTANKTELKAIIDNIKY